MTDIRDSILSVMEPGRLYNYNDIHNRLSMKGMPATPHAIRSALNSMRRRNQVKSIRTRQGDSVLPTCYYIGKI